MIRGTDGGTNERYDVKRFPSTDHEHAGTKLGSEQTKREAKSINYQSTIRIEMCMQSKYVALQ